MRRRTLLITAGPWLALSRTGRAFAQAQKPPVVIGWLGTGSPTTFPSIGPFREGMAAAGWTEGSQYIIVERWAGSSTELLPQLARELVDMQPAVIVAFPATSVRALAQLNSTIPIVQASGADLVALGLAKSLARPGGMITGLTNFSVDVSATHLELLLTARPQLRRIGFLTDPAVPNYSA